MARLPLRRGGASSGQRLLGWGNAFATGTFLGIGLVHLLPSAADAAERLGWDAELVFLLAAAAYLAIHSLIAGLVRGSQFAATQAGVIFAALAVHKATEAIALGVSLVRHGVPSDAAARLIAVFAASTALAAGTFIYIASVEMLRDEFLHSGGGRRARWLCTALGLAAISALSRLAGA